MFAFVQDSTRRCGSTTTGCCSPASARRTATHISKSTTRKDICCVSSTRTTNGYDAHARWRRHVTVASFASISPRIQCANIAMLSVCFRLWSQVPACFTFTRACVCECQIVNPLSPPASSSSSSLSRAFLCVHSLLVTCTKCCRRSCSSSHLYMVFSPFYS